MTATHHERFPKVLEKHPKGSEMSDVASDPAFARSIIDDAFDIERNGRGRAIAMAFDALKEIERKLARLAPDALRQRPRQWTERRVRSIVDREARRIDAYEIDDLKKMQMAEARHELNRSRARAARMAAFLAAQDEDFHSDEIERMGAFARGMDLPGMVRRGADK